MRAAYLDLVDYLAIAAEVTDLDLGTLSRVAQLNLADSARPGGGLGRRGALP